MIIPVKGYITSNDFAPIYRDLLGITVVSPSDIVDELPDDGSDVTLEIASDGGEVDPATEICNTLRSYSGNVTAKVVSNAYSAATIVAMGADKVQMAPGAKMMIHRASSDASGNVNDINKASGMLQTTDNAIADLYATKTGKPAEDFIKLMDSETWLTADQAIELGIADEKLDFDAPIVNSVGPIIPHQAVQRIKNLKEENEKLRSQLPKQDDLLNKKLAIFYDKKEVH
ncbi:Clp protease ClpP [Schleiferilactobacillus harbinensis]|uniref:head maturation protease, ClpP-related n=1 Tax=Schleiferilactobacillus harbinensis TaxID=304207 RepID=UPI0021A906E4|nr:head maturation protease, ClpP-related [Schleiferilactobacillus harbinensis]MCT2909668.1 Clp protease ClpP [Schleiferilactobacillus harbinensis]